MTSLQKTIIGTLVVVAGLTLMLLSAVALFWFARLAESSSAAAAAAISPTPVPTSTETPPPTLTPTVQPTATPPPTPVATRVVGDAAPPTPTATPVNCINQVTNFAASGALSDEQVFLFLQQTIPPEHLDHCRRIEYVHKLASAHGTAISGNFIPTDRKIFVYAFNLEQQRPQDLLDTLTHEIGHNAFFNLWRKDFEFEQRWSQLYRADVGFVSDYARFNHMEDFAETYRIYVLAPAALQQISLEKYRFMQTEVFAGREYLPSTLGSDEQ